VLGRDLILQKRVGVNIQRVLKQLDEYTLEAVCVYVLSNLFNSGADSTLVRAATFIDNLSYCIQYHYSVSSSRRMALGERLSMEESVSTEGEQPKLTSFGTKSSKSKAKKVAPASKETDYLRIASYLLEFLQERGVVQLVDDINVKDTPVRKKKGSYYKESSLYVQCLFSLGLLPIMTHLPMIVPPLPWSIKHSALSKYKDNPHMMVPFTDMIGGYLTYDSGQMMTRYRLLTSHQYDHFNIKFKNLDACLRYCRVITSLQGKALKVNKARALEFIQGNRKSWRRARYSDAFILG